jgi:hypothetical protein
MGMTHLQLQNAVVDITGRSDKKTDGAITAALNLAQREAAGHADFERLRTSFSTGVVLSDSSFTPPTNTIKIHKCRALKDGTDWAAPLEVYTDDIALTNFPDPSDVLNGFPAICYLESGLIKFIPSADTAYTMEGKVQVSPTDMSADGDTPTLDNAELFLIYWASGHIYNSLENFEVGMKWERKAEVELAKLVADENHRASTRRVLEPFRDPPSRSPYIPAYLNPFARKDD